MNNLSKPEPQTTPDSSQHQLTDLLRLLSDKTRLSILMLLTSGEKNVTWLCGQLKLPQPTVSHHLGLLKLSSVISNRRAGKQVFYHLNGRVVLDGESDMTIHTDTHTLSIRKSQPSANR